MRYALLLALLLLQPCAAAAAEPEVLVSRHLAQDRALTVGQTIEVSTHADGREPRRYRVAGTFEPVPDPMRFTARRHEIRFHLPDLVTLTADPRDPVSTESVTAINVALQPSADPKQFARTLTSRVPGLNVTAAGKGPGSEVFAVLERFHLAISIVTVLGSTAFLLALMVMRADERREVAGVLRLLGFSRRRVLQQALLEGLLIAGAGALFGVGFSWATQGAVNAFFQWRYDTTLVFVRVTPPIAARCVALAVPLGVGAGLLASWTLLRRDVLDLLRR